MTRSTLEADLVWTGRRFEAGVQVAIEDGQIVAVGRELGRADQVLTRRALLPGFIDTHSHAFQRGLRGLGETFPAAAGSFWTWRQAMYALVERLDPDNVHDLSLAAFREMRRAGITSVGEFHYIHHADPDALDFRLDDAVLAAAVDAGIRIVLLETFYQHGGFGQPLAGGQRRFATPDLAAFLHHCDNLATRLPSLGTLGIVAHSLRAADPADIRAIAKVSRERHLPFHIHLEEQVREVDECLAYHGRRPAELLLEALDGDGSGVTAIHCSCTPPEWLERLVDAGVTICLCPLTEGNLGDGIPVLAEVPAAWSRLALGSDSNLRLDMFEEMRWLDYGQRLAARARGLLRREDGDAVSLLVAAATQGGARALGLPAGRIAPGHHADFVAIDLDRPELAGVRPDHLAEALVYGASAETIAATAVAGVWSPRA